MQFYTDAWGAYDRLIDPAFHTVGKQNTGVSVAFGAGLIQMLIGATLPELRMD